MRKGALVLLLLVQPVWVAGCSSPEDETCTGDDCFDAVPADVQDLRPGRDLGERDSDGVTDDGSPDDSVEEAWDCDAGQTRCTPDGLLETCQEGRWVAGECPEDFACDGDTCQPIICEPEVDTFCDEEGLLNTCNALGTAYDSEECPAHEFCSEGECVPGCGEPGRFCIDQAVWECTESGEELFARECDIEIGEQCIDGECLDACDLAEFKRGYYGCEYLAADLPNDETARDNIFAFAFSNPSDRDEAVVTIRFPTGRVDTVTVPTLSLATYELSTPRLLMVRGSGVFHLGFYIESTTPISAFMFNPLEQYDEVSEATVATNDASLLIPTPIISNEYYAMTWSDPGEYSGPPYVTVVAYEDDTEVTVTPTETIFLLTSPHLALENDETTFTLDARDVLNLESAGGDLTGTRITSSDPVAVFSGNTCARVPNEGRFCDHIETQLPPVETWGTSYIASKFTDRGGESDYFRILALQDGTDLVFVPPCTSAPRLDRGEFYEFDSEEHFMVSSEKPFLVGQFMASENMTSPTGPFGESDYCPWEIGGSCWGDPSMVLVPPIEQLRADYIFLVPDTYEYDFINLAFRSGTTIRLKDESIDVGGDEEGYQELNLSGASQVGDSDWNVLTIPATSGFHSLIASEPIAVIVYGFDHNISYAYKAGLDFRILPEFP